MAVSVAKFPNAVAVFRFPNKEKVHTIQGKARQLSAIETVENGFVFHSFDGKERYVIDEQTVVLDFDLPNKTKQISTDKKSFLKSVDNIQKAIAKKQFTKVVAAKVLAVDTPENFDLLTLFSKVLKKYPEAFVCLVFIENTACWLCATPELLLKSGKKTVETYSLAGTLKNSTRFTEKEGEEQQIVTDSIIASLRKFPQLKKVSYESEILQNGHLRHLLTVIKAKKKNDIAWNELADELHPTPAVGTFPKENGTAFIQKNEQFNRSFYSGYLGEIKNGKARLFVNLRCAEITRKQIIFYAGCGITAASDAEKEWLETEYKLDILRSLI